MSESFKVAKWQSVGIVAAALISTVGAVSSALIQAGWFATTNSGAHAPSASISMSPSRTPTAQASFAGFIQSVREQPPTPAESLNPAATSAPAVTPAMYVSGPLVSQELRKEKHEGINWKSIPQFFESLK